MLWNWPAVNIQGHVDIPPWSLTWNLKTSPSKGDSFWKTSLQVPRKTLGMQCSTGSKKQQGRELTLSFSILPWWEKKLLQSQFQCWHSLNGIWQSFKRIYCFGGPGICWCQPGNCCTSPSTSTLYHFSNLYPQFTVRYPNLPPKAYRSSNQFQLRVKHGRESHGHH